MSVLRADAPFYWPLRGSIALQNGSGTPTFTRATAKWMFNDEGNLVKLPPGAIEMRGYRPVINRHLGNTDNMSGLASARITLIDSATSDADGTTKAGTWRLNASAGEHYLRLQSNIYEGRYVNIAYKIKLTSYRYVALRVGDSYNYYDLQTQTWNGPLQGESRDAVVSGGWVLLEMTAGPIAAGFAVFDLIFTSAAPAVSWTPIGTEEVVVYQAMMSDCTGDTDRTFSDYVAGNVSYGAGVNGIKYFATTKSGATIPESSLVGAWLNPNSTTNNLLYCRDLTNAVWIKTNVTAALTQTGIDGQANSSSLLTATANDATILQTISAASAAGCSGFFVRRVTGTGNVYFTRDGGVNWLNITSLINSGVLTLVKIENTSVLNPQVGFKIATNGDQIHVDAGINHLGTELANPILTTNAAVTVNADVLTAPTASNFSDTAGTILATITRDTWATGNGSAVGSATRGLYTSAANSGAQCLDGTNTVNGPSGTPSGTMRIGIRWSGSSIQAFSDGVFGAAGSYDGSFNLASIAAMAGVRGGIKDVAIWPSSLSDSDMIAASKGMTFDGSVASLVLSAQNSVMTIGRTIEADAAQINLSSQNAECIIGRTIEASAASLSLSAQNSVMTIGRTIESDAAALTITAPDGRVLLDDSPRSAVTIAATLANPIITARL